jgi:hypothetical protein
VTVTSLSKSLKTKNSFPQTQHSACESRSDLFTSSTRPTYPKRLLPDLFFLLFRVKAALEKLEVPSSSSEDSSSTSLSSDKLNLSILVLSDAMERVRDLTVAHFPLFLPLLFPVTVWIFPTWPRLGRLSISMFFWSGVRELYS